MNPIQFYVPTDGRLAGGFSIPIPTEHDLTNQNIFFDKEDPFRLFLLKVKRGKMELFHIEGLKTT